ncbi:HAD family phosphatase [Verrucomicrobiaceae bacterium N1E253]|uniref:HAD family phosphatase n=1 Tax=Oceaniferula marina TaxID=2748318 RepID=A0A851GI43_9BACT|nr:HAD family phosphatase [Oceaniferula marina]NWK57193.1 HAD family phosphatase [Oceaniferula marina]
MDFLFDIGNVIVGVDFIPSLKRLIPDHIANPETRLNELLERKDEFEAGRINADEYFPWAAETLGIPEELDSFMQAWTDIFSPNEAMWASIDALHASGHRLLLFSNIQSAHLDHLRLHYPIFNKFSGGIYSYQTGHIKPEPEIYKLAIETYGLTPGKTAYIDDLPANTEGGKQAGLLCHTYRADQHQAFLTWLDTL